MYATALLTDVRRRTATSEYTTINRILGRSSGRSSLARIFAALRNTCMRYGDASMLAWGRKVSASTARMLPVTLSTLCCGAAIDLQRVQPLLITHLFAPMLLIGRATMLMIQAARDTSARAAPQAAAHRLGSHKPHLMVVLKK